jgi:Cdc6-like AAA superfamily ATPase
MKSLIPINSILLDERQILEKYLAPKYIPLGLRISDDENYQSLMQQAAINISLAETRQSSNLFSVNGPPGTGKTTMLRDIIAALLVNRAICLTRFENPHDAHSP